MAIGVGGSAAPKKRCRHAIGIEIPVGMYVRVNSSGKTEIGYFDPAPIEPPYLNRAAEPIRLCRHPIVSKQARTGTRENRPFRGIGLSLPVLRVLPRQLRVAAFAELTDDAHNGAWGELVRQIRGNLPGAGLLVKRGKLFFRITEIGQAKQRAKVAAVVIEAGKVGYCLLIGCREGGTELRSLHDRVATSRLRHFSHNTHRDDDRGVAQRFIGPDNEGDMRLNIYIANHCFNCQEALLIAEQARKIPRLKVAVINLDEAGQTAPPKVVAVPTYLLDGRIVSLGNPDRTAFLDELKRLTKE